MKLPDTLPLPARAVLIAGAYFLLAQTSLRLLSVETGSLAAFWPPSGFLLATLLLSERRSWPMILTAIFPVNVLTNALSGAGAVLSVGYALTNIAEYAVGAWVIQRFLPKRLTLSSLKQVVGFALLGGLVSSPLSATLATGMTGLGGEIVSLWLFWRGWWISVFLGILMVAPVVLTLVDAGQRAERWTKLQLWEALGLYLGIAFLLTVLFMQPPSETGVVISLLYLPFPLLIWAAMRFGPAGASVASFVLATLAVWFTGHGFGPMTAVEGSLGQRLIWFQLYLVAAMFTSLTVAAIMAERRQTERTLQASENRHRTLLENLPQRVWLKSRELAYVTCNASHARELGTAVEEIAGKTDLDFHPAEIAERLREQDLKVIESKRTQECEDQQAVEGEIRHIHSLRTPILDENGHVQGLLGIHRDVTESHRATFELTLLAAAIEQASDAIVVTDREGIIKYVNPAYEEITGYRRNEVLGRNQSILRSGSHPEEYFEKIRLAIIEGEVWKGRITNRRKDGSLYEEEATITPVRDSSNEVSNIVAVKRDVTRESALEEQLRQAQRMEAVGQLAGGVAHDFNNLLLAILGHTEFALDTLTSESPCHEDLIQILQAAESAASLTRQLLAFSRRQLLRPTDFNLNAAIEDLVRMLGRIIGENIEFRLQLDPKLAPIHADRNQIEQVLMNLLVNARDAMPGGGTITITTRNGVIRDQRGDKPELLAPGHYVLIYVSDTGCGMDEETLSRIFEPFFTTKELGKGTGLGLSTVYGIICQHGGMIEAKSKLNVGTKFRIHLPASPDAKVLEGKAMEMPVATGSETILVAEDEQLVRDLARRILESAGYRVFTARNGLEAVKVFRAHRKEIDLVVMDKVMPVMSGRIAREEIAKIDPHIPFLFITGYSADETQPNAPRTDPLITKPFNRQIILERVREVLDEGGTRALELEPH